MTALVQRASPPAAPTRPAAERALRSLVSDPVHLAGRGVRALLRQPWFVAITLVQPVVWLLLFGALFENVVPAPNGDYIAYLTPGIVVMSALFSSGWAGMGFITDAERGVMDRLLVSPVRRGSVMTGSLLYQQVTTVVQTLVILALGFATGARFPGGVGIMLVFVGSVILLAAAFASYSNALALLLRSQESVIGAVELRGAAAVVPVLDAGADRVAAGLDRRDRPVEPGRLGGRHRPADALGRRRLEPGGSAVRRPGRAGGRRRRPGCPLVQLLPEVRLTHCRRPGSRPAGFPWHPRQGSPGEGADRRARPRRADPGVRCPRAALTRSAAHRYPRLLAHEVCLPAPSRLRRYFRAHVQPEAR